ncbi:hypothetical protein VaNZ11_006717 [Volvox africanus]|uniref:Protein kinase domain-containing protein n=1 Tax=Volvox africanus TaxID=51714 RepID=A0ABQ5S2L2_9CHLO|nr:hypothetical protein VaNZ11_006717 [Volvox africanus]
MVEVVHLRPLVLVPGLMVLCIVLGLGLWALIAASNAEERFRHDSAQKIAIDKAIYIQTELDKTFMPAYVVATTIQQNPYYYPPQPNSTNITNKWYLENKNFDKLAGDLIALTKAGSVRTVSAIPHGIIRTMYPLYGPEDKNWRAIGKNWLNDSENQAPVKRSLTSRNLTIIGPYYLAQGGIGIVGMQAIFVNASEDDTFGIPPGPNGIIGPISDIAGMLDLTWQPQNNAAPQFWGLVTVLLSWDALRDNVTNLRDLSAQGYDYVLTRPDKDRNLAVDWSPGIDPARPPGFNSTALGSRPLIYYDLAQVLPDPVIVKVPLPNVEWTLYVSRTGGWVPSWKAPLIAMVVIISLILSLLVFVVLVSRVQQRRLLRDVVEAAGKLASTTRTLEEEKNRMQALLARHFDLIDLLEGGMAGRDGYKSGGGGGSGEGDARIDILRQKMLLTGTSLRREQLGEAEQVTIQEMLGEGTFGKVYKGLWRGTEVAIKTIVLPAKMSGKEKREKMAVMEAAISSSLAHPNVVQTYTYHIRPLRDSSAAPSVAPPSPSPSPSPSPLGGGAAGAHGSDTSPNAGVIGPGGTAATNVDGVGRTQILADAGAIVVGSPDSSVSTASISINANNSGAATAVAVAAVAGIGGGGGGGGGTGTEHADTIPAPTAGTAGSQGVGPRGVSLDQPATAMGGIHSYEVQLVLEFCDRGCLRDALDGGAFFSAEGLNYPAILETAADIAKAMLHLHMNDVLHSDLKATNVMLKSTGSDSGRGVTAKVADFGLSVRLDHTATHISHAFQGSLTHMAPEVMLKGHISKAADVYAFGITMWEIFTGGQPYRGTPGALLGHQTSKEGRRPTFPLGTPAAFKELAERCWHADASVRPTFSEVLDLLTQMRAEIPGPTPPLQSFAPLHKKMALAAQQQQHPHPEPGGIGQFGGQQGDGMQGVGGNCNGGGGSTTGSGVGSGIGMLHKIGGPAAIVVGGRLVSLNAAMHSADSGVSGGRMLSGNSAAAGGTLAGLGLPGVLETISEEGHGDASAKLAPPPTVAVVAAAAAAAAVASAAAGVGSGEPPATAPGDDENEGMRG